MAVKLFHVGIKGAIVVDGSVLLLKRENEWSGVFWEFPGGRMEEVEEIAEALRRELREELPGIGRIEVGELLHAARVPDDGDEVGLVLLFYRVRAEVPTVVVSEEHIGYTWAGSVGLPALARGEDGATLPAYTLAAMRKAFDAADS